jgi:hypothetical protein
LVGGFYGYEISNNLSEPAASQKTPPNALARLLIHAGRRLAKSALELYSHDTWQTLWFLYTKRDN